MVAGRDCIALMPTGAGKSLTFQVPARLLDGTVLVVSPLISLMKDQVDTLTQLGFRAAAINSSLKPREREQRLRTLAAGEYELVYLAPEGLDGRLSREAGSWPVSLLVVTRLTASASGDTTSGPLTDVFRSSGRSCRTCRCWPSQPQPPTK